MKIAEDVGNSRTINTVILGCFMKMLGVEQALAEKIITAVVPQRFLEINLSAFKRGYDYLG